MLAIDGERLLADLRRLATFGKVGSGVNRPAFSADDLAARRWVAGELAAIGHDSWIDNVGNVFGRSRAGGPSVLVGSHTDSVPKGGWLDGALGVMYGLAIARAATAAGKAVDVISFQEEEGAFHPLLGSLAFCGEIDPASAAGARSPDGRVLGEAIAASGLAGARPARNEPGRYRAYLEAHIEQGPRLEAEGRRIGVVTGIVGIRRYKISFAGQADHAGTTPMAMRKDAGAALIGFGHALLRAFRAIARSDTVWNLGAATFAPGAANVVPASAELLVECRDTEPAVLNAMEGAVHTLVAEMGGWPVTVAATRTAAIAPTAMDAGLRAHLAAAAGAHGAEPLVMPSGAGHDAIVLARHMPAAMLFIPSIGGRSHDIAENTADDDIVLGCRVLADAVARILP
ncbi:MAG: M20 family metallo-hydrolase [Alphaproteobacteria bacterium]|nr:M20 family metallo-hydrolase [Alphaproteobacteria bacterium]